MTVAPRHPPVLVRDLADAALAVRSAGGQLTAPRRLVLEALLAATQPVSAEQIAHGLNGQFPAADVVSVYRNLEWFERIGLVRHVHLGHGPGLYELAGGREHEYLVCERCDKLISVNASELDAARARIGQAAGFHARFDHFPIHGLCRACADAGDVPSD